MGATFGKNFFASRNKFFKNVGTYFPNWVPKELMQNELSKRMYSIAIRVLKEDCLDLPEKVWSNRYTIMSEEQLQFYRAIALDILKEIETNRGKVKIRSTLDKIGKLSQILSGFMYTDTGEAYHFSPNPKLKLLEEVINEFPREEKIIIYCRWKEDIRILEKWCEGSGNSYVSLTGETENRGEVIKEFCNGSAKMLLCNIAVGKYSLTLTASSTIVYYSMGFGLEEFVQSSDRIHRISQTRTCLYLPLLFENGIDEYVYNSVNKKIKMAQAITDSEFMQVLEAAVNEDI